ncbi:hypothetical protein CEP50_11580 [Actinopolyspora mortivallis]|uniref:Uncharacterized protein n=1 Tax=Actinopolyspora mortivallis TaxID=33906 RepID=A0A2T0GVQ6_ACTMO|nr:hypothetical protein CEP50_11580 [Actinopolyspora mortivallis]
MIYTVIIVIVLPVMAFWIALAFIPWRPLWLRLFFLGVQMIGTVLIVALVDLEIGFMLTLFLPGFLVAVYRSWRAVRSIGGVGRKGLTDR